MLLFGLKLSLPHLCNESPQPTHAHSRSKTLARDSKLSVMLSVGSGYGLGKANSQMHMEFHWYQVTGPSSTNGQRMQTTK
eukprot:4681437-Amphidinium_carterae.1